MAASGQIRSALRRGLRQVARPVRESAGAEGLVVEPYRGFGDGRTIYLLGRVYRQMGRSVRREPESGDLWASLRRLLRRGAGGRTVIARFAGAEQRVVTDRDGYFHVRLPLSEPPPGDVLWHHVCLDLCLPSGATVTAVGEAFVPPERARFVVISDIDDTVMYTGVANKALMLWRLFARGAQSRVAFPGVAALYRALHGADQNPLLYVSRGPWSIYSVLEAFFQIHHIPVGPVLFLREWGVSLRSPLPRRARDHKVKLIRDMLELYADLPFVLVGDSGQHDPEIYAQVVAEHPGRVKAVYIRNVSRDPRRVKEIQALAQQVVGDGSSLLLASDSVAMAEHAAAIGLVPADTPRHVADERRLDTGRDRRSPLRVLRRPTRRQTQDAVADGELEDTLGESGEEPPSTLVEPEQERRD